MTQLKLRSGFTFDVTNLYGPKAVTEEEVKAFEPVYTKAHEAVMNMRKTGIMPGHLSKDGEPEEVLFPQLPYIEDGNINSPERIFALEELARTTRNRVDTVVFLGIGGSYLGGKVLFDVQCGEFWNLKSTEERKGFPKAFFAGNNVDSHKMTGLINFLKADSHTKPNYTVMAVVISKSGSTIEPMSNYMVLKQAMNDAGIALETVAVTDPHDGGEKETLLHGLAKKSGWPIFYVPDASVAVSASSPKSALSSVPSRALTSASSSTVPATWTTPARTRISGRTRPCSTVSSNSWPARTTAATWKSSCPMRIT